MKNQDVNITKTKVYEIVIHFFEYWDILLRVIYFFFFILENYGYFRHKQDVFYIAVAIFISYSINWKVIRIAGNFTVESLKITLFVVFLCYKCYYLRYLSLQNLKSIFRTLSNIYDRALLRK